jgi:hypothetical protein
MKILITLTDEQTRMMQWFADENHISLEQALTGMIGNNLITVSQCETEAKISSAAEAPEWIKMIGGDQ